MRFKCRQVARSELCAYNYALKQLEDIQLMKGIFNWYLAGSKDMEEKIPVSENYANCVRTLG